ncbi:hypothetical protein P692DRAFT_201895317 [Suillus brevipes Sb2]|nr:hypothetical protein P692DRAFT_201895317 [Suillus brevipes Sb2]
MNNNGAHSSLPTPNTSASSSTNNTPVVPNTTVPASSSTSTVQGPAPQHGALTFGTPAEQEGASRPRRDLGLQRARLRELRARQQGAAQRAQPQLRATRAQPPLPTHHGGSTRSSKRKAVDDADDTTRQKQKRHRPQDDPDFEPAQPGPDGKARWKCLKQACVKVKPMLEYSVHKHVTQTNSHQADSPESLSEHMCPACGASFKRPDAMTRHIPSDQYVKNESESLQASSSVLGNSALTAGPSSSGSVTQQSLPLPAATPDIVQVAGNSTSVAAAPMVMPQRQFTFQAQGPAPSSAAQQSSVQAMRTEPRSVNQPGPSLPVFPQEVLSLPEVQSDLRDSLEPTSVQRQPAVALPSQAIQGDFSTPDNTSIPLPSTPEPRSAQLPPNIPAPIFAGDLSFLIFKQAAPYLPPLLPPSSHSPSEEVVDDSSADLFSAPPSHTPSEDASEFSCLFSAPPSPPG